MKRVLFSGLVGLTIVMGFAAMPAVADQSQTLDFSLPYSGSNGESLDFNSFSGNAASVTEVILTLDVTGITVKPTFLGTDGEAPSATFTETVSVNSNLPQSITEAANFTAPSPLAQNVSQQYTVTGFTLQSSSNPTETIVANQNNNNLSQYENNFSDNVQLSSNVTNAQNGNYQSQANGEVNGTLTLDFVTAVPEPNSGWLALLAGLGFAGVVIARRKKRNLA